MAEIAAPRIVMVGTCAGRTGQVKPIRVQWVRALLLGGLLPGLLAGCAPGAATHVPAAVASKTTVATCAAPWPQRDWTFAADGVVFSNHLDGARLNGVERLGRYHYAVTIAPEGLPVNPSPWYGFSVRAQALQTVRIQFRYEHGQQRYWPHLSTDGNHWRKASAAEFRTAGAPVLTTQVGPRALQIFAQPPVTASDYRDWEQRLAQRVDLRQEVIGHSVEGRPLALLRFGNPAAQRVLLVIGRQHPPETTGAHALMKFVDRLTANTAVAREFRRRTLVLVVPVVNPDGVAHGNWRGNAHCVDVNRDWGTFNQPETRAVRAVMQRELWGAGRKLVFAIDFHSTWNDVLYTVRDDPSRAPGGLLRAWIDGLQTAFPGSAREVANAATSTVFKNWVYSTYGAPAVTYEVGDRTAPVQLDALAAYAADRLMGLLDAPAAATQE